jgi:hypothetical protein
MRRLYPCSKAAASTPWRISVKYGLLIADTARPMDRVREVTRERASVLGV